MTAARDALYDQLISVLGADQAHELMRSLPDETPATQAAMTAGFDSVQAQFDNVHRQFADVRNEIREVRTELKGDIAGLRDDMRELRTEMRAMDARMNGFYDALQAQTRTHIAASMGSAVTVAGLVFIAAQIV